MRVMRASIGGAEPDQPQRGNVLGLYFACK
jgi:hypothetical protein